MSDAGRTVAFSFAFAQLVEGEHVGPLDVVTERAS
jgi:hypothetical protein